jgi:DNA-binding HxlR family transcriptional regulator
LADRLRELREADIVTAEPGRGYTLTAEGTRLVEALAPVNDWAQRWARRAAAHDRQPPRRRLDSDALAGVAQSVRAAES